MRAEPRKGGVKAEQSSLQGRDEPASSQARGGDRADRLWNRIGKGIKVSVSRRVGGRRDSRLGYSRRTCWPAQSRGGPDIWSGGCKPSAAPRRRARRSRPSAERASCISPTVNSKG